MQIIVDIPDNIYKDIIKYSQEHNDKSAFYLRKIIKKGIQLPKDHGRLGDLDALEKEMIGGINAGLLIEGYEDYSNINSMEDCIELVKYADTIIDSSYSKDKDKEEDYKKIVKDKLTDIYNTQCIDDTEHELL